MKFAVHEGMSLIEWTRLYQIQPFELINGDLYLEMPQIAEQGEVIEKIWRDLDQYTLNHKSGDTWLRTPFVCIDHQDKVFRSYTPDIMYIQAARINAYKGAVPDWKLKPLLLVPDLVIEVFWYDTEYNELIEKIDRYLVEGTQAVWVIDAGRGRIFTHTLTSQQPFTKQQTNLKRGDILRGGEVIPGFEIPVASIFE